MNNKLLSTLAFALFFLAHFSAKSQCLYTLDMTDGFGDGWSGGTVTINSGGNSVSFTLDGINDNGLNKTVTFPVVDGAPLIISYTAGSIPWEVSFNIYENGGSLFFSSTGPATGTLFTGTGVCIDCAKPLNFAVDNIWDNRARLRWDPNYNGSITPISWRVIYGPQGFSPAAGDGDTLVVNSPKVTILGLQKNTWYDAYVEQYCDVTGGYSTIVGPISFQTYWTNDVGISGVIAPLSGCDLGNDSIKVVLSNYGAAPQSLITFRYSINGEDSPVVPPNDGFYTGVLGKDSSVVIAFETLTDFSDPGEYRIDVFSELATDEDLQNDTFTYYVTNRLQPDYVQNFETWNGGWTPGGENPSWEFGTPNKPSIPAAASGQNAWVTSLTGSYNASEFSYLESPCFDFSELTEDPAIEFSLIYSMQQEYDGAWLEMSLDGGQTWEKVGEEDEGKNWYNSEISFLGLTDAWSGFSEGWITARHSLPNSAGISEVRLRFVMASAPFFTGGGIGIDDVKILKSAAKDLASLSVTTLGEEAECGLENDRVVFTFVNYGSQSQSSIPVGYSINGAAPVIQTVPGNLATDQNLTHSFTVPFDSRDEAFTIKVWTMLTGDLVPANDSATYTIDHRPQPLPYQENFEALTLPPADWTYDPPFGFTVTNGHNNISNVLAFNLYSGNPEFTADLPRMGKVNAGDSLRFSYRITNFESQGQTPTILQTGTKIEIQVSTDCGETFTTINTISGINHSPTIVLRERKLSLDAFAGQDIKIRFHGIWGASDFWFDLDNINILSCASEMELSAAVTPATPGQSDGAATVNVGLGNPPYTFNWSSGQTTQTATGLAVGAYVVTVFDAFGCSDTLSFNLGTSATNDPEAFAHVSIFPNPTAGPVIFQATFSRAMDAQIEVLSPLGQRIWSTSVNASAEFSQAIDLSGFPEGLYLVRISGDGKVLSRKLVKE